MKPYSIAANPANFANQHHVQRFKACNVQKFQGTRVPFLFCIRIKAAHQPHGQSYREEENSNFKTRIASYVFWWYLLLGLWPSYLGEQFAEWPVRIPHVPPVLVPTLSTTTVVAPNYVFLFCKPVRVFTSALLLFFPTMVCHAAFLRL